MVDLVDQPSGNGATAAAAQWWSAEQCPDDAQGQGGPTDMPDLHQTKPKTHLCHSVLDYPPKIELQKMSSHLSRCASVWFEK